MADTTLGKAAVEGSLAGAISTFAIAIAPMVPVQYQPILGPLVGLLIALLKAGRNEYAKAKAPRKQRRASDSNPPQPEDESA